MNVRRAMLRNIRYGISLIIKLCIIARRHTTISRNTMLLIDQDGFQRMLARSYPATLARERAASAPQWTTGVLLHHRGSRRACRGLLLGL
jgi:hypothetical protein